MRDFTLTISNDNVLECTEKSYEELLKEYRFVYHIHKSLSEVENVEHTITEHVTYHLFSNNLMSRAELVNDILIQTFELDYDCIYYVIATSYTAHEENVLDIFSEEEGQKYL